jgi:hypothetical protein
MVDNDYSDLLKLLPTYDLNQSQLEITPRSKEIVQKKIDLALKLKINHINFTDKMNNLQFQEVLEICQQNRLVFSSKITATFSVKNNYFHGNKALILGTFDQFWLDCVKNNVSEILVVSGSGNPRINTLDVLKHIHQSSKFTDYIDISVAYNPYLPYDLITLENNRLEKKLQYPFVTKVYLQIGVDLERTKKAIELIRSIRHDIAIVNCVVIPSKRFLQTFSFRPWKGVYFPQDYLNDISSAFKTTAKILDFNQEQKIPCLLTVFY